MASNVDNLAPVRLEIATDISQRIADESDLDSFFWNVVKLIQERFGFYHAQIFTRNGDDLLLQAATGKAGEAMIKSGHRFSIYAKKGVVAFAARVGTAVISPDVYQDPRWYDNSEFLPETRTELALPIILRDEVIGVLDVQGTIPGSIGSGDELILKGICVQIASAMSNLLTERHTKEFEEQRKKVNAVEELNATLLSLLKEKEMLLKEVHHRVKNNLQIISSLLSLQSREAEVESTRLALLDSTQRIHAIALVHENLYKQPESVSHIPVSRYITQLVEGIFLSIGAGVDVARNLEIEDVVLDMDSLVSLGLIVNELATNAIKHAYLHGAGSHKFDLKFRSDKGGNMVLIISDNGPGFAEEEIRKSLGLKLVNGLVQQLGGWVTITSEEGTQVVVTCPCDV